jgi:hypothetical protein
MLRHYTKKFVKVNAAIVFGGAAFTILSYPELRKEPYQLINAMRRGLRCGTTCALMASDYIRAGENITSQTHYTAATRMFNCFCQNGGPYIKLG